MLKKCSHNNKNKAQHSMNKLQELTQEKNYDNMTMTPIASQDREIVKQ